MWSWSRPKHWERRFLTCQEFRNILRHPECWCTKSGKTVGTVQTPAISFCACFFISVGWPSFGPSTANLEDFEEAPLFCASVIYRDFVVEFVYTRYERDFCSGIHVAGVSHYQLSYPPRPRRLEDLKHLWLKISKTKVSKAYLFLEETRILVLEKRFKITLVFCCFWFFS